MSKARKEKPRRWLREILPKEWSRPAHPARAKHFLPPEHARRLLHVPLPMVWVIWCREPHPSRRVPHALVSKPSPHSIAREGTDLLVHALVYLFARLLLCLSAARSLASRPGFCFVGYPRRGPTQTIHVRMEALVLVAAHAVCFAAPACVNCLNMNGLRALRLEYLKAKASRYEQPWF